MRDTIKKAIFDFVKRELPDDFKGKLYWVNERKQEPSKPYCMMRMLPDGSDAPTTEEQIEGNKKKVTQFRSVWATISILVDGTSQGKGKIDLNERDAFAYNTAKDLQLTFDTEDASYEFMSEGMSIQGFSEVRPLSEPAPGGYLFRYEFDIKFGYDKVLEIQKLPGRDVNLEIKGVKE